VFRYSTVVGDTTFIQTLLTADLNNNIMAAGTGAGGDSTNNICNISNSHAYSILSVFNITATNPVTDGKNYGIFIVPATNFATCFTDYQIGYYLDNQGYQATYYDEDNASGNLYSYTY